jgi:peptidylprolyl isomerase
LAAAAAARKRAARRRVGILVGIGAAVIVAVAVLTSLFGDDREEEVVAGVDTTTAGSPTTAGGPTTASPTTAGGPTTTRPGSVAGAPCVARTDPLPAGAPEVPVPVGPPPTALVVEDLEVGTGPVVPEGARVVAHYVGVACSTGKIFDSSYTAGQPVPFPLTSVIEGWREGIPGMHVGGRRLLGIPPEQAYGSDGRQPSIAPDETLWFVVDVVRLES